MIQKKAEAVAPIVRIATNPKSPGHFCVTIRCPFCGKDHQHGMSGGDMLLGVIHCHAHCNDYDSDPNRKGLRKKRRQQLKEGRALRERCGGGYFIHVAADTFAPSQGRARA